MITTMAGKQHFSKTTHTPLPKIDSELEQYAGENVQALLKKHAGSGPSETLQNAYQEYIDLLRSYKELSEKHKKEAASLLNTQIRGTITLSDKTIADYKTRTNSSIVKLMKNDKEDSKAIQELHTLISAHLKLKQVKGESKAKEDRPNFSRVRSREDGLRGASNPPKSDTAMETDDKSEKKKELPLPQSLTTSVLQGRPMAHLPMIEYQQLVRRLESQQRDIEEMTTRLSRFASNQVTQGNPNIADLSDKNRPTKIGEKFGELYDNEWSEAYEAFKEKMEIVNDEDEPKVIEQLLRVVHSAQMFCADVSNDQLNQLKKNLKQPILEVSFTSSGGKQRETKSVPEDKGLETSAEKYAKNFRKECALRCIPAVIQLYKSTQGQHFSWARSPHADAIHKYVDRCIELIWLMSVQDPPMYLVSAEKGDKVRTDLFTYYGSKGKVVESTVWPAVLLHSNGPIISKGYIIPMAK
ncbi:uncharacterized protein LOC117329638 [Pecten maximus]|uniref:uncharacterized protein LOC117329638 n=1 Tax=Pecten maximus TaxID=6579 RepID=UPI0014585FC5|nr:uncharacterized protein LOC117329638 [Pecten maximus]